MRCSPRSPDRAAVIEAARAHGIEVDEAILDRLATSDEPPSTWLGCLWASTRASARARVLDTLGSGRAKVALADVGLATQLFTPAPLARWMAARTLDGAGLRPHVYDPCCGTGNLLVAAVLEAAARNIPALRLTGYDLDPEAVAVAAHCVRDAGQRHDITVELTLRAAPSEGPEALLGSLVWRPDGGIDGVLTNPPWLYQRNMAPPLRDALKALCPPASRDLYTAFLDRCVDLVKPDGYAVLLTPRTFLAVRQYEALRRSLAARAQLVELVDLGPGRFPALSGEKSSCTLSVWRRGGAGATRFADRTGLPLDSDGVQARVVQSVASFAQVPGMPWAFGVDPAILALFERHPPLGDRIDITGSQNITANNGRFVRFHWEVPGVHTDNLTPPRRRPHFRPYAKGGRLRRYAGNLDRVVDWSEEARTHYAHARTANLLDERYWYREGITYTDLTTHGFHARHLPAGAVFDKAGPALFPRDPEDLMPLLGLLNTPVVEALLGVLNATLHTQVGDVRALPVPILSDPIREALARRVAVVLDIAQRADALREASPWFGGPVLSGNKTVSVGARHAAFVQAWSGQIERAVAAHGEVIRIVSDAYGVDPSALAGQRPLFAPAPCLRECLAQLVAVQAAQLAQSQPLLDVDLLAVHLSRTVSLRALHDGLGESLRDHMLGGAFWSRHVRIHQRSPRLWLRIDGGAPRLFHFVDAGRYDVQIAPGASSRQAWRALFGADPR